MLTLKANTAFKAIAVDNEKAVVVLTYAQAYTLAFEILNLLGTIRELRPEDEPYNIIRYLPELPPEEADRILDPHRELVPDLKTVLKRPPHS